MAHHRPQARAAVPQRVLARELGAAALAAAVTAAMRSKTSAATRVIMPCSSSYTCMLEHEPIVNVLPLPVWPYANTVALYPSKQPSTRARPHDS